MKKVMLALLGIWFLVAATTAADSPFNDNVPDEYTVKGGDTLWDIAAYYLREPWVWPEIWHVNPQINNPHLIYPGDVINLVYIDGQPKLSLARGRNVKLRPKVKEVPHSDAISTLPLETIKNFLSDNRVVEEGELEAAPYVVSGYENRLLSGQRDNFYARGTFAEEDNFYGIFRTGDPYIDPNTQELLGLKATEIGAAKVLELNDDIASLKAIRTNEEIRLKDRLLIPEDRKIDSTFHPSAPPEDSEGVIVSVENGLAGIGTLDVIAINLGERDDLEVGNMLAIYKKGEIVTDPVIKGWLVDKTIQLPPERIGLMMVFRTFEKMCFGLVLTAERPFKVGDLVLSP